MGSGLSALRGAVWGIILLAHVCGLSIAALTFIHGFPSFGETTKSAGNILGRYNDVKESARALGEARDTQAFGQSAVQVQKQIESLKDTADGGKYVPAFQLFAWLLLGFVSLSLAFLTVAWWRAGFRGLVAYSLFALFLIPFSLGALGLATAMMDGVPENKRPFELSVRGFQELGGDALPYLTNTGTLLAFILIPAIGAAVRSHQYRR